MSARDQPSVLTYHYVLSCPCGELLTGDTEDEVVQASFAHLWDMHRTEER